LTASLVRREIADAASDKRADDRSNEGQWDRYDRTDCRCNRGSLRYWILKHLAASFTSVLSI